MTDDLPEEAQPTRRRRKPEAIRVLPPEIVPLSPEDERQAVTALAAMIAAWWHDRQHAHPTA